MKLRILLCMLFVFGLSPRARADGVSYEYTMNFISPGADSGLQMSLSFAVPGLLDGTFSNIDLNDVRVTQAPSIGAPVVVTGNAPPSQVADYSFLPVVPSLLSVSGSNTGLEAEFRYQVPCNTGPSVCAPAQNGGIPYRWQAYVDYSIVFDSPMTGPGVFLPIHSEVDVATNGNGPIGESHNGEISQGVDSISIMVIPEPTTGLLVGACFLCTFIALLRRKA